MIKEKKSRTKKDGEIVLSKKELTALINIMDSEKSIDDKIKAIDKMRMSDKSTKLNCLLANSLLSSSEAALSSGIKSGLVDMDKLDNMSMAEVRKKILELSYLLIGATSSLKGKEKLIPLYLILPLLASTEILSLFDLSSLIESAQEYTNTSVGDTLRSIYSVIALFAGENVNLMEVSDDRLH